MDGLKRALKYSLQLRLSLLLSSGIIVAACIAGLISFYIAFLEANEIQDDQLRQMAMLASKYNAIPEAYAPKDVRKGLEEDDALISMQILGKDSYLQTKKAYKYFPALPADLPKGFYTISSKKSWRVFVFPLQNGEKLAVAQRTSYRDDIAFASAKCTIVPLLLLAPILSLLTFILVRRMLRSVAILANAVDTRTQHDITPLDTHAIPLEIQPFALSINRLLLRVSRVLEQQRRFVADAAHELRSPLTALSLQIQSIDCSELPDAIRERIAAMTLGMERTVALLGQLLNLARSQSKSNVEAVSFNAYTALRTVLEELIPVAEDKAIDLGIMGDFDIHMVLVEADFHMVANNLIDNALKYTPSGGKVDVALNDTGSTIELIVTDTGCGIPVQERERVFDSFYRSAEQESIGSGLGLSIVKTIVEKVGASICLDTPDTGVGLRVTVCFRK